MPDYGWNRTYTTFGMLALPIEARSVRICDISKLSLVRSISVQS